MANSSFFDVLRGYESHPASDTNGKKFASIAVTGSVTYLSQSRTMRRVSGFFIDVSKLISYTSTRTYGFFLLGFGLLAFIINFVMTYFGFETERLVSTLVISGIIVLVAVPFSIFDKPILAAMQDFPLTDYVIFDFFCIQPTIQKTGKDNLTVHPIIGLILGLVLAVLTIAFPIEYVVLALFGIIYVYLTFISPEFSLIFTLLALPFIPLLPYNHIVISVLVLITSVSFFRKVISGKRVYFFEQYDIALFFMVLFVLISGIFVKGIESFTSSLVVTVLALGGYMLASSLTTNRRLGECAVNAISMSSVPVSVLAIVQFITALVGEGVSGMKGSSSTFDTPEMLAAFLLVSSVFTLYFAISKRRIYKKVLYTLSLALSAVAMLTTLSPWAFFSASLGVIVYFLLKIPRGAGFAVGAITLLPYGLLFLPSSWLRALAELPFISELGFGATAELWINSRRMFLDNIFSGIGMGSESFALEYANYAENAVAYDSHNLLLQVACEAGIFAAVTLIAVIVIRLIHRSIYVPYVKNSQVAMTATFAEVALSLFVILGLFTPLWSDFSMFFMFFAVLGLGSGLLRVAKHEFDDRVGYFSDGAGIDFSSIDISIR